NRLFRLRPVCIQNPAGTRPLGVRMDLPSVRFASGGTGEREPCDRELVDGETGLSVISPPHQLRAARDTPDDRPGIRYAFEPIRNFGRTSGGLLESQYLGKLRIESHLIRAAESTKHRFQQTVSEAKISPDSVPDDPYTCDLVPIDIHRGVAEHDRR